MAEPVKIILALYLAGMVIDAFYSTKEWEEMAKEMREDSFGIHWQLSFSVTIIINLIFWLPLVIASSIMRFYDPWNK